MKQSVVYIVEGYKRLLYTLDYGSFLPKVFTLPFEELIKL